MPSIGYEIKLGFGPGVVQIPGGYRGAHNVVTPLNNHRGYVANAIDIFQKLVGGVEETVVNKVVTLNAGHGEGRIGSIKLLHEVLILNQKACRGFPNRPGSGRG